MYIHIYMFTYVVYKCAHIHTHTGLYKYIYIYIDICRHKNMCIGVCVYLDIDIHTCTTNTCLHGTVYAICRCIDSHCSMHRHACSCWQLRPASAVARQPPLLHGCLLQKDAAGVAVPCGRELGDSAPFSQGQQPYFRAASTKTRQSLFRVISVVYRLISYLQGGTTADVAGTLSQYWATSRPWIPTTAAWDTS